MKRKVYIRTDGSADIGLGHIVRCMSLSHMLTNDFTIRFYALEIPDSLKTEIIQNGWEITDIEKESDFLESLCGKEIVALDGYQFDSDYQKQIKSKGCKLVCIDDFHDQYFYADLVINHAPGVSKDDYEGESYTKYLLGPDYALLRPEFLDSNSQAEKCSKGIKNIFICFGGADSKNLTAKLLSWLPSKGYTVTIVLGNAYNHQDVLNKIKEERKDLEIHVKSSLSAKEMRNELEKADLAIVPASGISLEVLVVGVPAIIGHYTSNQVVMYEGLVSKKGFYAADDFSKSNFSIALKAANENYELPEHKNPSNISKRLESEFKKLRSQIELSVRKATEEDIDDLFEWANDPVARKNSYRQEKVEYASHVKWVVNKLSDSDCLFLIFEKIKSQKIGFVRFDIDEHKNWIISINVAPSQRGKGYSVELLRRAVKYFIKMKGKRVVWAYIKKVNIASIKAFERAGFEVQKEVSIKGEESILMIWK
ncbi:UDP-2,4-diacetamido-2,4,6-trideoxy-beta-L-altropyranose hydrolase [Gracilimonas tropica]|uniref:UDP-2,4-diacetamido-2,4, 6-trideoxy-beta-L-altropyranose hydrolase n=1 Tax=Gracilimonas tropica TaxID=454600 RepID=UPI00037F212F|nr:UDP-2,4-diacetamido-2,4,6-trideoxy-beta-L-altropyranose hydrolase [Gracilimonas tropica]